MGVTGLHSREDQVYIIEEVQSSDENWNGKEDYNESLRADLEYFSDGGQKQ